MQVSVGENELGLVVSDAEGESVLGRLFRNVRSRCPACNFGSYSLDWGSTVFTVLSMVGDGALDLVR